VLEHTAAYDEVPKDDVMALLQKLRDYPENFLDDVELKSIAVAMVEAATAPVDDTIALNEDADAYTVFGADYIEEGARTQMNVAMKLPVTAGGALMPDAHQGYGLPIGGVLATRGAIIPYGVGVDIGCRMALSVFDIPEAHFFNNEAKYKRELIAFTKFGAGAGFHGQYKADHEVLDRKDFNVIPFVNNCTTKLTRS